MLRISFNESARDQSPHINCDQMDGRVLSQLTGQPRIQLRGGQIYILTPVEPEGVHVPPFGEREEQLAVIPLHDACGAHIVFARAPVIVEPEPGEPPGHDAESINPDEVSLLRPARGGEDAQLASHQAVKDDHVALRRTPGISALQSEAVQLLIALVAEVGAQALLLFGGRICHQLAQLLGAGSLDFRDESLLVKAPPLLCDGP